MHEIRPTRRALLRHWLSLGVVSAVPALALAPARAQDAPLALTPSCDDAAETPSLTEGPFYTPGSPMRRTLVAGGGPGERIMLMGLVLARDCRPLGNAIVDLWHAGPDGRYDNDGYDFRGHQLTDSQGRFWFDTVVPGLYGGRTRHYHVKVQPPGARLLTTQLYFPDEPRNGSDWLFEPALVMTLTRADDGRLARFDFVVDV